jgi:hypothetical protein
VKVAQIISRALRLIKVLDAAEAAEGEDAATAIESLNAMCTRWEASGLSLGWVNVSNPDDDLPAPDEAELALAYNLAILISPEYEATPAQLVFKGAEDYLRDLRRDRIATNPLIQRQGDLPLPSTRSQWGGWR